MDCYSGFSFRVMIAMSQPSTILFGQKQDEPLPSLKKKEPFIDVCTVTQEYTRYASPKMHNSFYTHFPLFYIDLEAKILILWLVFDMVLGSGNVCTLQFLAFK